MVVGSFLLQDNHVCANTISCIKDLSGEYKPDQLAGVFLGKKVTVPAEMATNLNLLKPVLGENTGGEKRIFVDLSKQLLTAFEGGQLVLHFPVSTGKWKYTPTGDFRIWVKLKSTLMSGGDPANGTYYYLPNVPFTMYFYNAQVPKSDGYGLHGAYWHDNFGHPMSHGCINIKPENAQKLFYWADPTTTGWSTPATDDNPGTLLTIYGETPIE